MIRQQQEIDVAGDRCQALEHINDPDAVWITRSLGSRVGEKIALLINDQTREYTVRGFIPESCAGERRRCRDGHRRGASGHGPQRTRRPHSAEGSRFSPGIETWEQRIRAVLPAGVDAQPAGQPDRRPIAACSPPFAGICASSATSRCWSAHFSSTTRSRFRWCGGVPRSEPCARWARAGALCWRRSWRGRSVRSCGSSASPFRSDGCLPSGAVRLLGATVDALYVSSRPGSLDLSAASVVLALVRRHWRCGCVGVCAGARGLAGLADRSHGARRARICHSRGTQARSLHRDRACWPLRAIAARLPAVEGKPFFGYLAAILLIGASSLAIPALVHWCTATASAALRPRHWASKRCSRREAWPDRCGARRCWWEPCPRPSP